MNNIFNELLMNIATPLGECINEEYIEAIQKARNEIRRLKEKYENICEKCVHYSIVEEYSREIDENGNVVMYKTQDLSGFCERCKFNYTFTNNFLEKL